ncbi:ParA family protein [Kordiimonas aquimaris]|uniref:ParA family protein n=1 Tax=Kordiimonas aquimaris TaxID=707591 RepID=UPI0021D05651|nr:ParA family protein [Kordiimonas aquimaris]
MRVIAVSSQKGGSGKTTITGHLAVEAARQSGEPVALIDTDPQGSLSDWWNARESDDPAFAQATMATLDTDLSILRDQGFRLVFIDTPPAITRSIQTVVQKSDLVIIPTRPSPHDLRAAGKTVDLVERAGKPLVFVVNGATARARLTGEAAIALSQHGTVAPTILHNRQDFAASMIDGRTVMEANSSGRSAGEVTTLWQYLDARIKRLPVKSQFKSAQIQRSAFGNRQTGNIQTHHIAAGAQ